MTIEPFCMNPKCKLSHFSGNRPFIDIVENGKRVMYKRERYNKTDDLPIYFCEICAEAIKAFTRYII